MFFDDSLLSSLFPLCADWQKSDSSVDGEPHESGGGIQIPETYCKLYNDNNDDDDNRKSSVTMCKHQYLNNID